LSFGFVSDFDIRVSEWKKSESNNYNHEIHEKTRNTIFIFV